MSIVLVGGGPDTTRSRSCIAPFVEVCKRRKATRIGLLLAGDSSSAEHFAPGYLALLDGIDGVIHVVPLDGGQGDITRFDAIVVGGGPTPVYHEALAPVMPTVRDIVTAGTPYLGFSAGAMIASERALIGGYLSAGIEVCSADWSEGLDEVTLRPGIGIVPWTVEVHAAQTGTLGRVLDAVVTDAVKSAVALDEDTALHVDGTGTARVLGSGRAWWASHDDGGARVNLSTSEMSGEILAGA